MLVFHCIILDIFYLINKDQQLQMNERRNWTEQEDNLIRQCIQNSPNMKWSLILKAIKNKHPDFKRTSKQLRERWKFYLNPQLCNQNFSTEEQQIIFKSHVLKGSKWKQIQKLLPNRSQKTIQNFLYMSLRKSFRRISKILGAKNSTNQSRQLKPQVISKLIQSYNESPEKRYAVYKLYNLHKMKSGQCRRVKLQHQDVLIYSEIIDDLLSMNSLYIENKKQVLEILEQKIQNSKIKNITSDKLTEKSTIYGTIQQNEADQSPIANLNQIQQQDNMSLKLQCNSINQDQFDGQFQRCYNQNQQDLNMFQT